MPARDDLLELVETGRPTVVKLTARLGLEGILSENDLRRLAEIPKGQLYQVSTSSGSGSPRTNV